MDLRYSIRTVRNDLAFKVYGISDKVRDYCHSLRNDEHRAISNVLEYIPTPSKIVGLASTIIYKAADLLIVLCKNCKSAPCWCHNSKSSSKEDYEDYHASYYEACLNKDDCCEYCHDIPCSCYTCEECSSIIAECDCPEGNYS